MKYFAAGLLWFVIAAPSPARAQLQPGTADEPAQIGQAETLIRHNKPKQAYSLLAPLESRLAGNVHYDYLLGISALNSDKAALAVFALERVQATDPQYREIGLWLAIAHYRSGDVERAKTGFEAVLHQSTDKNMKDKAQRYLDEIKQKEMGAKWRPSLQGKLEGGIGHDSNITNSTTSASAPQLAAALPAPSSNRGGMVAVMNLGAELRLPIFRHYAFLSAEDRKRSYSGHEFMDSDTFITRGGLNFENDKGDTYRLSVVQRQFRQQGTLFAVNGTTNDYDISGGELRIQYKMSPQTRFGTLFQYNQVRFLTNSPDDTDQGAVGINYTHVFDVRGKPLVNLGYLFLYDQAIKTKASYNPAQPETSASRVTQFISGYFQYSLRDDLDIVSTDYLYLRNDLSAYARAANVEYGKDRTQFLSLGVTWRFEPKWSLRSRLAKTTNRSNIPAYAYEKTEVLLLLRRDF